MPYIDPTNVVSPTSTAVNDTQANGSYTGVPQHVIVDGKDFLIVDADVNGVAIYGINSADGALITPPTYLTWAPGGAETGDFDQFKFYESPDGAKFVGFDGDQGGVAGLTYNVGTSQWSVAYDGDGAATAGIKSDIGGFDTWKGSDGNIYGYGANISNQTYYKYQWDWNTNTWNQLSTTSGTTIGQTSSQYQTWSRSTEIMDSPDGNLYMVTTGFNGPTGQWASIINRIDPATGNIVPNTNVYLPHTSLGPAYVGNPMTGEITFDPAGHMVFTTTNGLQVINPTTGAIIFNDTAGGAGGQTFYYGMDIIYGNDGYVYLIGRDGNTNLDTKVYQIDANGNWTFVAAGKDALSLISWPGMSSGSYPESGNDVTTLSSGVKVIYTTQESGANGPNTLIAVQVSTIGEAPAPVCFAKGTDIETERGLVAVENLRTGDLVKTKDNGYKPIWWIGRQTLRGSEGTLCSNLLPVRIRAGALGCGMPEKDLQVSQQHRVLVKSKVAQRLFGSDEVLIAAKRLVGVDGISIVPDLQEVTYFHLLFDQHEIVYSNGAETESLYTGPEALKSVTPEARKEIFSLFPELSEIQYSPAPVRNIPCGKDAKNLIERMKKNHRELYAH